MSRFFATGSDSESTNSSLNEPVSRVPTAAFAPSDDDEENAKRVVRSTKTKRFEELANTIKQIKNFKKIKDISSLLTSFENLIKAYTKALPVINKEEGGITPKFYVQCLIELEDFINEVWEDREERKNLSKNNSKSLATLRQKLRKNNKDFDREILKLRESPENASEVDEEQSKEGDEDADSDANVALTSETGSSGNYKKGDIDDGSDDSSDWGSDSESGLSSLDDESNFTCLRDYFLKKSTGKGDDDRKERRRERKKRDLKKKEGEGEEEGDWVTVIGGVALPQEKPKMFSKDDKIDISIVLKKLGEIIAVRGKKGTNRRGQIELLHELQSVADSHHMGPAISIKIKFAIISSIYDYNPKVAEAMKLELWPKVVDEITDVIDLILSTEGVFISINIPEENESLEKPPYRIRGCILTIVERLDEEFTKLLKECDPHGTDYVQRLASEKKVSIIIDSAQEFLEKQDGTTDELCRIYMRKIDHLYYKFDPNVFKQKKGEIPATEKTSIQIMDKLCKYVYDKDITDRLRTRAILSHVYHHSLHDNWFQARDLILMSHLQESINHSDPSTQILYNRTMAQLGLCAFRHGSIQEAHNCLVDLMVSGKIKELLAQGLMNQRQHERSTEQKKVEKLRQMPFHMHINLELIESVYLISAMFLEIPYLAAHGFDMRRRMISKNFYQQLRISERQTLIGPPESMREHVVAASKAMRNGDWAACSRYTINDKMNVKVWNLFLEADKVRAMVDNFIKEGSLKSYLFTYAKAYKTISLEFLAGMYELDPSVLHSIVSKMIINGEVMGSLDDPSQILVMHRSEPSRVQSLAIQLVDRINSIVDSNERIFETKQGRGRGLGQVGQRRDRDMGPRFY